MKKFTLAQDKAYDKAHGIKEGSKKDNALDKKRGVSTGAGNQGKGHGVGCGCDNCKKMGAGAGGNWIKGAIKSPGALHKSLGVPAGQKIPAKKLSAAAKSSNPTTRKRANLAKTLGKLRK